MAFDLHHPSSGSRLVAPGDLLCTTLEPFRQQSMALLDQPGPLGRVDIDLTVSRMVDSVGLNLLVTIIKRAKARGGWVRIRISHPSVRRTLVFTRIDQHAEVTIA